MNIALIGYGKMGRAIEKIALERGHTIALTIDIDTAHLFTREALSLADVAIEFTGPNSAFNNVMKLLEHNIPVVCGSTGWLDKYEAVEEYCLQQGGALLYASNFSVGVNIFFELNKKLATLMARHTDYTISMEEIHHTQKKDAPSGTAVSLAEQIMHAIPLKKTWVNHPSAFPEELQIISKRIDPAPGTHVVTYSSAIDDIEIKHTAHNRTGFATGAVMAAEFLTGKKGIFTMKDVLGL
jgi:4-hydroxy-tetrahydrodipicolinate reductase